MGADGRGLDSHWAQMDADEQGWTQMDADGHGSMRIDVVGRGWTQMVVERGWMQVMMVISTVGERIRTKCNLPDASGSTWMEVNADGGGSGWMDADGGNDQCCG